MLPSTGKKRTCVVGVEGSGFCAATVPLAPASSVASRERSTSIALATNAVSTDNVILAGFAAQNDDLEVRGEPFTKEPYGIGLAKDDTDFRMWINDVLEASYEDGSWTDAWEATAGTVLPTPEPPAVDRY